MTQAPTPSLPTAAPAAEASGFFQRPLTRWVGVALVLAGFLAWRGCSAKGDQLKGGPEARAVPVTVADVQTGDLDISLTSLGTVTSLNAALIRSRVDGVLMAVHFQEGQLVQAGQLLAEIDPRPFKVQLMQAEGQLAKDQAALRNAKADQERVRSLSTQGIVSRQVSDTQDAQVMQLEAAVKVGQAALENAKLNLLYSRVTSPVSGRVGLRQVDPGNMVRTSDANGLVWVTPTQPITVMFTIPADAIQRVLTQTHKGIKLLAEAFDRDFRRRLASGTVVAIDNQVDPATGTVKLRAQFDNADDSLYPNQFVNIRLRLEVLKNVLLIPTAAVQRSPQETFVYVLKGPVVELRSVTLQGTDGDRTAISKGLQPGEQVVTEGLEKLRPGAKVTLPTPEGPDKGPKKPGM